MGHFAKVSAGVLLMLLEQQEALASCSAAAGVTAGDPDATAVLSKVGQEPRGTVLLCCDFQRAGTVKDLRSVAPVMAAAGSHRLSVWRVVRG